MRKKNVNAKLIKIQTIRNQNDPDCKITQNEKLLKLQKDSQNKKT